MEKISGEKVLVLMGLKHSGKSSIGEYIAAVDNSGFTDLDRLIMDTARREGYSSIRELYRTVGLKNFQVYELEALKEFFNSTSAPAAVLALGGGTADNQAAMELSGEHGYLIYLKVGEDVLFERILRGGIPPFLQGEESPREMFHHLYRRRDALYQHFADLTVELSDQPLEKNCSILYSVLKEHGYVR